MNEMKMFFEDVRNQQSLLGIFQQMEEDYNQFSRQAKKFLDEIEEEELNEDDELNEEDELSEEELLENAIELSKERAALCYSQGLSY